MPSTRDAFGLSKHTLLVIGAFFCVYVIWGSTYLAIRLALESFPPFIMAGLRFIMAGGALYGWLMWRGAERPKLVHWRSTAIIGALLLVCANGGVVWAEQTVESGLVSLIVSVVPIWVALLDWIRPGGKPPSKTVILGLFIGFAGVAFLIGPSGLNSGAVDLFGTLLLLGSSLCWASGTVFSRNMDLPKSPLLATAMEMICGGIMMLAIALATNQFASFNPMAVKPVAFGALMYLTVFGSLIAFSAFMWLLGHVSPARVATYAYVNPVVAVFLGWAFAGEAIGPRTLIAAAIILFSVALITNQQGRSKNLKNQEELEEEIPGPAVGANIPVHTTK